MRKLNEIIIVILSTFLQLGNKSLNKGFYNMGFLSCWDRLAASEYKDRKSK